MQAFGLAKQLDIGLFAYIDIYFTRYPGVKAYMEETREFAKKQGDVVRVGCIAEQNTSKTIKSW